MRWKLTFLLPLLLAAGPYDPHPLTEAQRLQAETANDKSPLLEEAAYYALLENAADWSDKQAGSIVPDYDSVRRDPESWRGQRCLIEGTLYKVLRPELMRPGWERVQGLVLRIDHTRDVPVAEDFVIVYLTHPPAWTWKSEKDGVPHQHGSHIRVIARFYKVQPDQTERAVEGQARWKNYAVFVGHAVAEMRPAEAPPTDRSWQIAPAIALAAILIAVVLLALRLRSTGSSSGRIQEHIQQRRLRRHALGLESDGEEAYDEPVNLSQSPDEALDDLAEQHRPPNTQD